MIPRRSRGGLEGLRLFLHLLDVPVLYGIFVGSYFLRFRTEWFPDSGLGTPPLADYQSTFVLLALGWCAFLWAAGVYERLRFDFKQAVRLVGQLVIAGGFSLAIFFFRRDFSYSRLTILLGFAGSALGLCLFHWLKSHLLLALLRRGFGRTPALVVGPRSLALSCLARFAASEEVGLELLGYVDDPALQEPVDGAERLGLSSATLEARAGAAAMARSYVSTGVGASEPEDLEALEARFPRLGAVEDIAEVVTREGAQEIFVVHPITAGARLVEVLAACENTAAAVRFVPDVMSIIAHGVRMRLVAGVPVLDVGRTPLQGLEGTLKKLLDVAGAGIGLLLLSPIFAYLAWRVKRDSPGPILYEQERVGMDGRPFTIFKFRSMPVDAEAATGPIWATKGDARATPFGAFMRKWSLDELPQLWNVLRGDMSLVGPRPERPHFVDQFRQDIQGYMQRHKVKAGITGWAQINGLRGECPIEERTRYDIWYIENWSLALDVEILARTLWLCFFNPQG